MNKGFTLVELLAVIVILALISGIGIVSFGSITSKSNSDYYANLETTLELEGSNYFTNNRSKRPSIDEVCSNVSLQELIDGGYIDSVSDSNGKSCDLENSYVYIKRNGEKKYEYKAHLLCGDYNSLIDISTYCVASNVVSTSILLSATDTLGNAYSVTNSYNNTAWTNKNIKVTFDSSEVVTKYVIKNSLLNETVECGASNNICSYTFDKSGTYEVSSYNGETQVSSRNFNIRIDKTKPVVTLLHNDNPNISVGDSNTKYENKVTSTDESGISKTTFIIVKNGSEIANVTSSGTSITKTGLTSGRYTLKVKVYDKAQNESEFLETNFYVSRSIQLRDSANSSYEEIYKVIDGATYNYLSTSLPVLTKSGYTFLGWYRGINDSNQITNESTVDTTTTTLWARWE